MRPPRANVSAETNIHNTLKALIYTQPENFPTSAKGVRHPAPTQRATNKLPPSAATPPIIMSNVRIDCLGDVKQISGSAVHLIGSLLRRDLGGH
jgi:hypothetical protein